MDYNTILNRFGFDSSNFVNKSLSVIETDDGYIYEVYEAFRQSICPNCNYEKLHVHSYKWVEIKLNTTINFNESIRIRRIRYKFPMCGKTHTFELKGIERKNAISQFVINSIKKEFFEIQSFATIGKRYGISTNEVIRIFDEFTRTIPRRKLPEYLCIDEKHFEGDTDGKYCVILSDFFSGEIVDVIENRQMPYLDEYFKKIALGERKNVKVFISDMYDGYSTIKNRYFPNALFVVDLFHVIKLLTTAVNKLRIRTYNQHADEGSVERHFLKNNWRYFLKDLHKIKKNEYYSRKYNIYISYDQIIVRCLKLNMKFWDGYSVLQDLLHYDKYETYTDAESFMNRIINKLELSCDDLLIAVAKSFRK